MTQSNETPSGKEWEAYRERELKHWKEKGKSSGIYFEWNGQRWRLDRKNERGRKVRYSPKSVDVKNQEGKGNQTARNKRIQNQTAGSVDPKRVVNKTAMINRRGNQAHHINPTYRVENGIVAKYGEIPDNVREQFAKQGMFFGDDPRNLMGETPARHSAIHSTEAAMDAAIRNAGNAPSVQDLVKDPKASRQIFEVGGGIVKRLAKTAVPAAAGGVLLSAAELGQRAQAAQSNPSALNLLQTGISAVETAADGVAISGYTSGVGAPLGLVADGVSFAAGITNGGIDAVRQISGAN